MNGSDIGGNLFRALVHADTRAELQFTALDLARDLFGPDAHLQVEHIDTISTTIRKDAPGRFCTTITIRCDGGGWETPDPGDLPAEWFDDDDDTVTELPGATAVLTPEPGQPGCWWTLIRDGDQREEPMLLDAHGNPPPVTADPRTLPVSLITDDDPVTVLTGGRWQLAALRPLGTVTEMPGAPSAECDAGWTITSRTDDLAALYGPQHAAIRTFIAEARQMIGDGDSLEAVTYCALLQRMYEVHDLAAGWETSIMAALTALEQAGADTGWWTALCGHRDYSVPLLAVAARDLITDDGQWTETAYSLLTGPWLAATGQLAHPNDQPMRGTE
jgi:hypothetical protein